MSGFKIREYYLGLKVIFSFWIFLQGTRKRSQTELETELEKIGARFDSYTSREHNAFYIQCIAKDVENGTLKYRKIRKFNFFQDNKELIGRLSSC